LFINDSIVTVHIFTLTKVLNTTARIEGQCNNYHVKILLSSELLNRMQPGIEYKQIALGEISLKGKEEKVFLYTIEVTNKKFV